LQKNFARKVHEVLRSLKDQYSIDWDGGSQDSAQGLVVELEEF